MLKRVSSSSLHSQPSTPSSSDYLGSNGTIPRLTSDLYRWYFNPPTVSSTVAPRHVEHQRSPIRSNSPTIYLSQVNRRSVSIRLQLKMLQMRRPHLFWPHHLVRRNTSPRPWKMSPKRYPAYKEGSTWRSKRPSRLARTTISPAALPQHKILKSALK